MLFSNKLVKLMCIAGLTGLCLTANATALDNSLLLNGIVEDIQITGNQTVDSKLILTTGGLFTHHGTKTSEEMLQKDLWAIYATGYFKSVQYRLERYLYGTRVVYIVQENPTLNNYQLIGNTVIKADVLDSLFVNQLGYPVNWRFIKEDIQKLEEWYKREGYDLNKILEVDYDPVIKLLSIKVREALVERVEISGNIQSADFRIKREMQTKPGTVYNSLTLRRDRNFIMKMGLFSAVSHPELIPGSTEEQISIRLTVAEQKVNILSAGLLQQDSGVAVFLNAGLANIFQTCESFSLKAQYGQEQSYALNYYNPWLFDTYHTSIGLSRRYDFTQELLNDETIDVLRNGWNTTLGFPLSDEVNLYLIYQSMLTTHSSSTPLFDSYQANGVKLMINYDDTNRIGKQEYGLICGLKLEQGGNLGLVDLGGLDYGRYELDLARLIEFWSGGLVGMHLVAGLYHPNEQNATIIETESYSVGGGTTIRGISDNDPLIGPRKLLGNFEIRQYLGQYLQVVLFYDLGSAYTGDWSAANVYYGRGLGIRFITPFGPLRFDYGWSDGDPILHFGIGQVF